MKKLYFEWDENKAKSNLSKHGITFEEAVTVFYDDWSIEIPDPDHSQKEERFVLLGLSRISGWLLVVCYCYQEELGSIRIISARKATGNEAEHYAERKW